MHTLTLAFFENLFRGPDLIILLVIALLLFGKRLPEVGRGLGKGIIEFRKGLRGIEDEIEDESKKTKPTESLPDRDSVGARPPLTSTGEDARVSRSTPVESHSDGSH
jgi:TatA/E family protein of Tat protein translocase